MHAEDSRDIKVGGVVIWDGGLGICRAEGARCVPVGGEFWFDWAGVVEAFEDCFNISRHREFTGTSDIILFQCYSTKCCASPIFMHSFVIYEQDVEEVLGMLLPGILHSKVVDHEGEHNGAGGVCP